MAINETIENGFYRIRNATNTSWRRIALWTKASQVERANGANLEDELEMTYLRANKTIYVKTTGSDTTGDGSSTKPYATTTKALAVIPKNLNGYTATINIYAGTYNETINIKGYFGGPLRLTFQANLETIINGGIYTDTTDELLIYQSGSGTANVTINPSGTYGLRADLAAKVYLSNIIMTVNGNSTVSGVTAATSSEVTSSGFTLIANNSAAVVVATRNSSIYISSVQGTGNIKGIDTSAGGVVSYGTYTASATTNTVINAGGFISNDLVVQSQITALDAKIGSKVVVSATAPADTSAVWVY